MASPASVDAERRSHGNGTGDVLTNSSTASVTDPTDSVLAARPVVPLVARAQSIESDARLAGERAAARVALLEPLRLTERCACQAASIDWLRWAGRVYGGCPHGLELAS